MKAWESGEHRRALEGEGVRFLDLRVWVIRHLLRLAVSVEPVIALDAARHLAEGHYDDPLLDR